MKNLSYHIYGIIAVIGVLFSIFIEYAPKTEIKELKSVPYLGYSWESNYASKYLNLNNNSVFNIKTFLNINNISTKTITNINIKIFLYDISNVNDINFNKMYDVNMKNYSLLHDKTYDLLKHDSTISIDIIKEFSKKLDTKILSNLMLPQIGNEYQVNINHNEKNKSIPKYLNISFTDDEKMLKKTALSFNGINTVNLPNKIKNGTNGLRLKVMIEYDIGSIRFTDLLMGGCILLYL